MLQDINGVALLMITFIYLIIDIHFDHIYFSKFGIVFAVFVADKCTSTCFSGFDASTPASTLSTFAFTLSLLAWTSAPMLFGL